jgi:RNA polymerase sigma-70 factor (ECF subfamily)
MACDPEAIEGRIRAHLDGNLYFEAFDLLLASYQDKVFRLAWSILGDRTLAEDSVQDIFVRVWRALPGYRGQSSISTWVYAIARNTCFTASRRNRKSSALSLDDFNVRLAAERTKESVSPPELDLPGLIAQLPEKYRQVILLFYMEEKTYDEVARLLDLPMGTVKTYLHRARKALAAAITEANMKVGKR